MCWLVKVNLKISSQHSKKEEKFGVGDGGKQNS
jgi:hypothetical protein